MIAVDTLLFGAATMFCFLFMRSQRLLRFKVAENKKQKNELEDLRSLQAAYRNWQNISQAAITSEWARAHAAMLDGGATELKELRDTVQRLEPRFKDMRQERDAALGMCKELKTLATLAAVTAGRQNVSPELVSAIGLTIAGKMDMSDFSRAITAERNKALTDNSKVLETGPQQMAYERRY